MTDIITASDKLACAERELKYRRYVYERRVAEGKMSAGHWSELVTDLPADQYLVVEVGSERRRAVRWNGFMWADHPEAKARAA